ncbi:MAG: energy-coupling factor transporter transmembrane protein EcfT [Deltaproteobacteria bacterium]|nr:energy-coupling factor transporter transmembrane protein EcfT [Deltaproteobacteria bacterium]
MLASLMANGHQSYSPENEPSAFVNLIFCLFGSMLALYLRTWPPLALLVLITFIRAYILLGPRLLIKIHLILALLLLICLSGVVLTPSFRSFGGARPAPGLNATMAYTIIPMLRMSVSANLALSLAFRVPTSQISSLIGAAVKFDWLFIPLTVVLRFIGAFLAEINLVRDALMVRTRKSLLKTFFTRPWILWRGFFVPMTFRTLAAADDLAISLEMRGLRRSALFWPRPPIVTKKDAPALAAAIVTLIACLLLSSKDTLLFIKKVIPW